MGTEIVPYDEIREELLTGTIVLFSGKGFVSRWIKRFSRSKWSHVGMIVRGEIRDVDSWGEDLLLLWESTTLSTVTDTLTGTRREGVQLVQFSERLREYPGRVAIRRLERPLDNGALLRFARLRKKLARRPYERSIWELLGAAMGWNRREDLRSVFCSELVAESYQALGLFGPDAVSNRFTPEHFAKALNLRANALGPVEELFG
jgi:hypothetical protein